MPALASAVGFYLTPTREPRWYKHDKRRGEKFLLLQDFQQTHPDQDHLETDYVDQLSAVSEYFEIFKAIENSRCIEELEHDWDDEGAQGYSRQTWRRAAYFVALEAEAARDAGLSIGIPAIAPADEGSIDIYWRNPNRTLLINVPAAVHHSATFYGRSIAGETISGLIDTTAARTDLLMWLSRGK